ncbi:hypothetical protein [Streptomyces sp. NPDC088180]|uniref:hypothetical protein n=1 Tax=Streptomyces sp. NPDC088180 TaxID=3365837 RepID=UPI003806B610
MEPTPARLGRLPITDGTSPAKAVPREYAGACRSGCGPGAASRCWTVGESARSAIRYARALGKPVRFTHPEADPDPSPLPVAPYEIVLSGAGGMISLPAVEPVPGLHVYELPDAHREEGDGAGSPWRLGHHSGRALAAFSSEDDALRAAHEVADLADWTRPAEGLRTNEDFDLDEYVDRIETRANGLLITPRKGSAR